LSAAAASLVAADDISGENPRFSFFPLLGNGGKLFFIFVRKGVICEGVYKLGYIEYL
jgi:hypothetical protein